MQADLHQALVASRAERQRKDGWQSRYADLEQQIEELALPAQSAANALPWLPLALVSLSIGLFAGVAIAFTLTGALA